MKKRKTTITRNYLKNSAGSVLIETGNTKVLCTANFEDIVPPFINPNEQGWLTAEYSMLPGSTIPRSRREVTRGKISGRTAEIQRLIGRSLRAVVELEKLPGYTIQVDCDVLQADGGTRTAAVTGACIALFDAFVNMKEQSLIKEMPLRELVAAISVGVVDGENCLDLDYIRDSHAEVDMNIIMTESGKLVEVQGTAEGNVFIRNQLNDLLDLSEIGIKELIAYQRKVLNIQKEV